MENERFVTAKEAAEYLRCSAMTISRLSHSGKIPAHPITFTRKKVKWLYKISELDAWAMARNNESLRLCS